MYEESRRHEPREHMGEIDLIELARGLWQEKWVIIGVTAVVTLCALVYSLMLSPVYETSARTIPPRAADVAPLNLGRAQAGLSELDPSGVYAIFIRNLTAETTRRNFFVQHYRPFLIEQGSAATRDELTRRMREDIVVRRPDERNNPHITEILVQASDPEIAAEWNNIFLQMAADEAFGDLTANTVLEIKNKKTVLERRIEVLREFATTQREDRIARLKDALNVAEAVGVDAPQVTAGRTAAEDELSQMIDGNLAYMRGSKAIQAELELLQARENEDPYIGELRNLQQQINLLSLVNPAPKGAALFTLDSAAEIPDGPIEPRKKIIVGAGIVLGGMLGSVIALVRIAIRKRKVSSAI
ncbi:hypothetical protein LCGC14_0144530 [marine sediment metagenome]